MLEMTQHREWCSVEEEISKAKTGTNGASHDDAFASLRLRHASAQGSTTSALVVSESTTFPATTVIPCTSAVAAMSASRFRPRVWHMERRAFQGDNGIDGQRALQTLGQHIPVHPGSQPLPQPGVVPFDAKNADFQLHEGQRRDVEPRRSAGTRTCDHGNGSEALSSAKIQDTVRKGERTRTETHYGRGRLLECQAMAYHWTVPS